MAKN
jgi:hypothetical protein